MLSKCVILPSFIKMVSIQWVTPNYLLQGEIIFGVWLWLELEGGVNQKYLLSIWEVVLLG